MENLQLPIRNHNSGQGVMDDFENGKCQQYYCKKKNSIASCELVFSIKHKPLITFFSQVYFFSLSLNFVN